MIEQPGFVAIPALESARFTSFTRSITGLQLPEGSVIQFKTGTNTAANVERLVQDFLADDRFQWIYFLGDDQEFPADSVTRLLEHDKDIVTGLIVQRYFPFKPLIFESRQADGSWKFKQLEDGNPEPLVQVAAAGTGGMLVRRHVLEALDAPIFELQQHGDDSWISEDMWFCHKATQAGFEIWCDTTLRYGHSNTYSVWPTYEDDKWRLEFRMGNGFRFLSEGEE
jgi:hypothetical protein